MLITKTPFRISFVGGGTDLKEFYGKYGGAVLSTSIDKYIYLSMHKYFYDNKHLIKYSKTEEVENNYEIKHNIIREIFQYFNIENADFNSTADIPSGTGMGSSSAFTCGLINLCSAYKGISLSSFEIAKLACEIEIEYLKEPIGKQDQYGCAIGGLKLIIFNPDESVEIRKLSFEKNIQSSLENNLFLIYTSLTRKASTILNSQRKNTEHNLKTISNLHLMSKMALNLYNDFENNNFDILGDYLNESWFLKKELSNNISNYEIDYLYNFGIKSGATGGKLLGAGGGGFILFYVPTGNKEMFFNNMSRFKFLDFKFENNGTQIVFNDKI